MIQYLHDRASSWFAKFILLLIVGVFVVWGAETAFDSTPNSRVAVVATVGDQEIGAETFLMTFNRALQSIPQEFKASPQFAKLKKEFAEQALQAMIQNALYTQAAADLNLHIADETLQREIVNNPQFFGENGQFDRNKYLATLQQAGIAEEELLQDFRNALYRQYIADMWAGVMPPAVLLQARATFANETRDVDYVFLPSTPVTTVPDTATLDAFYAKNKTRYLTEEQRNFSYIIIDPKEVTKKVNITDEAVGLYYQNHINDYKKPVQRQVLQVQTDSKDALNTIKDAQWVDLGWISRAELPAALGDAVFAAAVDTVTQPVQTDFGWTQYKVLAEKPETVITLQQASAGIKDRLRKELGYEQAYDLAGDIEDKLLSGYTLESAVAGKSIPIEKISGVVADNRKNTAGIFADNPDALTVLFKLAAQRYSNTIDLADERILLARVDGITAPQPQPLDTIKSYLIKHWQQEQGAAAAIVSARTVAGLLAKKEDQGLSIQHAKDLQRSSDTPPFNATLVAGIFNMGIGQTQVAALENGVIAIRLAAVRREKHNATADAAERDTLQRELAMDYQEQFLKGLQAMHPPVVHDAVFQQVLNAR